MADIFDFYVYDDRSIKFALAEPIMLEDKDVTQFRFRIPKVLNNIDMSSWEWWFIFVNAKKVKYTTQLTLTDDEDEPENYSVATYTVGYGFSGYVGQVSFSIEALNVSGEDIVNEWHTRTYNTHVIDTLQGTRAVVPEPGGQAGTGLTQAEKNLILTLFSKAAYAESDASIAYNALENLWTTTTRTITYNLSHVSSSNTTSSIEQGQRYTTTLTAASNYTLNTVTVLMGGVNVTSQVYSSGTITIPSVTGNIVITATAVLAAQSITATYTQSGTVYDTDSLDSLKADLVVTANYSGGTSETIPSSDYTLSGTLTVGTSTITVSYAGLTDTFDVTVTDYHNRWSYSINDLTKVTGPLGNKTNADCGMMLFRSTGGSNQYRRSFVLTEGETSVALGNTANDNVASQTSNYYPIKIPEGATSCNISVTPSTQCVQILARVLNDGVYSSFSLTGWSGYQEGGGTKVCESAPNNAYIFVSLKYDEAGTSYPTEPTGLDITFS